MRFSSAQATTHRQILARVTVPSSSKYKFPRDQILPYAHNESTSPEWLSRSELLFGTESLRSLSETNVLVVGLGGVGGFAAEFLARSGIGKMTIVDGDTVDVSNKNRQIIALDSTIGSPKVSVMATRIREINPAIQLTAIEEFLDVAGAERLVREDKFDFVVDCIDSIAPKKMLIAAATQAGMRVVCSMGAGGRVDPQRVRVVELSSTYNDKFATNLRKGLRRDGVALEGIMAAWSDEPCDPNSVALTDTQQKFKRSFYGTSSYMPAAFGLAIAAYVIQILTGKGVGSKGYRSTSSFTRPVLGRPSVKGEGGSKYQRNPGSKYPGSISSDQGSAAFGLAIAAYVIQILTGKGVGSKGYRSTSSFTRPVLGCPSAKGEGISRDQNVNRLLSSVGHDLPFPPNAQHIDSPFENPFNLDEHGMGFPLSVIPDALRRLWAPNSPEVSGYVWVDPRDRYRNLSDNRSDRSKLRQIQNEVREVSEHV
eukprot:gene14271-20245_t